MEEQAAVKIESWGCTDQLLKNKIMYEEVTKNRRNLTTAWLDYRKAFDSVPQSWIIESLQLEKVPDKIIDVIKMLMSKWRTKLYLYGDKATIETLEIEYHKGVLQGDMLSSILLVLSVNPLSYILHKKEGYKLETGTKRCNLLNLFFVDDLKLYTISLEQLINLLKIVVEYSKDIGMSFGDSKCAYQCLQRAKGKEIGSPIRVDHLTVQEIKEGDNYKYLGIDESVGFDGPLNKERVIKEYKRRVNRIWRSELNAINKSIAHNSFAVPLITPTIGVLNWTKEDIRRLDVTTRKLLTMNGSFYQSSDLNRIYPKRKQGGKVH